MEMTEKEKKLYNKLKELDKIENTEERILKYSEAIKEFTKDH